ncbi:MAG: sigma-70 family RNA polymerase sigma factor [Chloroflexi bacterium]|nr:sigma-70 family RNA polymerase sigma factor [Chloroflexota bacterium]
MEKYDLYMDLQEASQVEDETALLRQAKEFNMDALARIYDFYHSKIYRYVYSRVGDRQIAEDLTGEVFMRMLEALRAKRGWQTSVAAWLYGIAHHLVVDYHRARHKEAKLFEEALMTSGETSRTRAEERLEAEQIRRAMGDLTPDQQQVLTLKFVEGMSNQEVAQVLGKTEGAVKSIQYRALATLARVVRAQPA